MFLIFVMNTKVVMSKNTALERIESHEKTLSYHAETNSPKN